MTTPSEQWWAINGATILDVLRRAEQGEDPDMLYLELIANTTEDEG